MLIMRETGGSGGSCGLECLTLEPTEGVGCGV